MSFGGVRGFKSEVRRRGYAREGVAVLMNERVWICVREIRRVNSRIMYVEFCIKREFWTVLLFMHQEWRDQRRREMAFGRNLKGLQKYVKIEGK